VAGAEVLVGEVVGVRDGVRVLVCVCVAVGGCGVLVKVLVAVLAGVDVEVEVGGTPPPPSSQNPPVRLRVPLVMLPATGSAIVPPSTRVPLVV
jgi:hypothetical protein